MIHNSDKQRYDCGHTMKKKTQHLEADKIFFRVSAYESFKSKLTSNSPVTLWVSAAAYGNVKIQGLCELKQGFVMAIVNRAIRYIRECPLRKRLLYESAYNSLNEKWIFNNYSSSPNGFWVFGLMGYWLRGHKGKRNNCFSKIQLVGQQYRDKTTFN